MYLLLSRVRIAKKKENIIGIEEREERRDLSDLVSTNPLCQIYASESPLPLPQPL